MEDDLMERLMQANERSYQRAFETAVRTGTELVFARNGKLVEVKPPYRYELVKIEPPKKKKSVKAKKK